MTIFRMFSYPLFLWNRVYASFSLETLSFVIPSVDLQLAVQKPHHN